MRRGRPLRVDWQHEEAALLALYRAERDPAIKPRLQLLWRVRAGDTLDAAAAALGVGERSAWRWVDGYRRRGLAGVRMPRACGKGRASKLDAAQQQQLRDHLAQGTTRTAAEACAWVAATFGVTYSPHGFDRVLRRLRARPKLPRPISDKADPAAQAAWKGGAWAPR
jgi:transposase